MDGKLLARVGAAVFVGLATAMTIVQLREGPSGGREATPGMQLTDDDPLPEQLKACAEMGEPALTAPECRAAWSEKRRRFLGVDHPGAHAELTDAVQPPAAEPMMPSATGNQRGSD
jgi:conjugative transfer region protein TrbK